jgi:heme oxygenase
LRVFGGGTYYNFEDIGAKAENFREKIRRDLDQPGSRNTISQTIRGEITRRT